MTSSPTALQFVSSDPTANHARINPYTELASPSTPAETVEAICTQEGPYGLLKLCKFYSRAQANDTTFIQRLQTALKKVKDELKTEFGDITNKATLGYFLDLYDPDQLHEYIFQTDFLINAQNLCVACTGEGEIEHPGNLGDPVLHLAARMQLGNREEFDASDVNRICEYNKGAEFLRQSDHWQVILSKWLERGWDPTNSTFMVKIWQLFCERNLSVTIALITYNHHPIWPENFILTWHGPENEQTVIKNPSKTERLLLLAHMFSPNKEIYSRGAKWWPELYSRLFANIINNLFFSFGLVSHALNKIIESKELWPTKLMDAICRLATEIATEKTSPCQSPEMKKEDIRASLKTHLFDYFYFAIFAHRKASLDNFPLQNAANMVKRFLTKKNVEELIDFIFENKPITDQEAWRKASLPFELAERAEFITADELTEVLNTEEAASEKPISGTD